MLLVKEAPSSLTTKDAIHADGSLARIQLCIESNSLWLSEMPCMKKIGRSGALTIADTGDIPRLSPRPHRSARLSKGGNVQAFCH
jgi:hypothetical protein